MRLRTRIFVATFSISAAVLGAAVFAAALTLGRDGELGLSELEAAVSGLTSIAQMAAEGHAPDPAAMAAMLEPIRRDLGRRAVLERDAATAVAASWVLLLAALAAASAAASAVVSRGLTRRWARLRDGVVGLGRGAAATRFFSGQDDEFGAVEAELDAMVAALAERERMRAELKGLQGWGEASAFLTHQARTPLASLSLSIYAARLSLASMIEASPGSKAGYAPSAEARGAGTPAPTGVNPAPEAGAGGVEDALRRAGAEAAEAQKRASSEAAEALKRAGSEAAEAQKRASSEAAEALKRAGSEASRLSVLFDKVRSMSGFKEPRLEPLDPEAALREAAVALAAKGVPVRGQAIAVERAGLGSLPFLDRAYMVEAFSNLLSNSAEAAAERGIPLSVRVVLSDGDDSYRIDYSDSVAGLDPALALKVGSPRFTTKPGGMGLGVWLVGKIAALHGGALSVGSTDSGGLSFSIRLPKAEGIGG